MSAPTEPSKDARLDLRLPAEARALIVQAASLSGTSLTDYVLSAVVPAARREVIEATTIRLTQDAWVDFLSILDRRDTTEMAALREHTPQWGTPRP